MAAPCRQLQEAPGASVTADLPAQIGPDGRALSFAIDAFDRMDAQRRPWVVPAAD